jgi:hypothetical protein
LQNDEELENHELSNGIRENRIHITSPMALPKRQRRTVAVIILGKDGSPKVATKWGASDLWSRGRWTTSQLKRGPQPRPSASEDAEFPLGIDPTPYSGLTEDPITEFDVTIADDGPNGTDPTLWQDFYDFE